MNTPTPYSALRFTPLSVVTMLTAILIVMGSHHPSAQTVTSDLRGTVTDATGAVLAGALVKAEGPTDPRETTSDADGFFRLSYLAPGAYTVTVSQDGFQTAVLQVSLALDRTITLDVDLAVGQTEEVTVRAEAPARDRSRSSFSSVVSPATIEVTPVNGRNYLDLIRLTPGVVENGRAGAPATGGLDTSGAILGERAGNTSFLMDGLWNNNTFGGGVL